MFCVTVELPSFVSWGASLQRCPSKETQLQLIDLIWLCSFIKVTAQALTKLMILLAAVLTLL